MTNTQTKNKYRCLTVVTNSKSETLESKLEIYFESQKFFQNGDTSGKKAFFCLGVYTSTSIPY
jgi:hypothetical protein